MLGQCPVSRLSRTKSATKIYAPFNLKYKRPTSAINSDSFHKRYYSSTQTEESATSPAPNPLRVFSGIQPTGIPHIGNYLGTLRYWVELQDSGIPDPRQSQGETSNRTRKASDLIYSVVDLHALTVSQPPAQLLEWRWQTFASLLAIGLDPEKCVPFFQGDVHEHSELMWILSTIASTGYLSRMTQWKSKLNLPETESLGSEQSTETLKLGLFSYPVLQAADILLYRASHVPVGDDQKQHIEFARTIANSFNHAFPIPNTSKEVAGLFQIPEPIILSSSRILSLRPAAGATGSETATSTATSWDEEATSDNDAAATAEIARLPKMSKSHPDPRSRILVTDDADSIRSKIRTAVTDSNSESVSYEPVLRPGVSNLLNIYKSIRRDPRSCEEIADEDFKSASTSTATGVISDGKPLKNLKEATAAALITGLDGVRDRYLELTMTQEGLKELKDVASNGSQIASMIARSKLNAVKHLVGLSGNTQAMEAAGLGQIGTVPGWTRKKPITTAENLQSDGKDRRVSITTASSENRQLDTSKLNSGTTPPPLVRRVRSNRPPNIRFQYASAKR